MRSIRLASSTTLAIALAFFGCGGSSSPTKDASVANLDTGMLGADSGGAVSDTGGASSLDSGAGDMGVVEGGVRDGAGERSISTEVGPALDLAGSDVSVTPEAPADTLASGQDSG